jgi:hypothetical protein
MIKSVLSNSFVDIHVELIVKGSLPQNYFISNSPKPLTFKDKINQFIVKYLNTKSAGILVRVALVFIIYWVGIPGGGGSSSIVVVPENLIGLKKIVYKIAISARASDNYVVKVLKVASRILFKI